jgi:UDP-N-acetylmuramate dehydrogenase
LKKEWAVHLPRVLRGKIHFDEPMALRTSLKVGGPADCFAVPADLDDLQRLIAFLVANEVPHMVIGGGYNLLVRDGGFRGVIISLEELRRLECKDESRIYAEAGVSNRALVDFARKNSLTGLEFLIGIPGRLGGAVAMNAGAGGQEITDRLETLITLHNDVVAVTRKEELHYGYRFLQLESGEIILGASFMLEKGSRSDIACRIEAFQDQRRSSQQVGYPNAGSFFKNPVDKAAWRFIGEAGLRGFRIGGAQVSEVHTNFLVNRGNAKAADFIALVDHVKKEVCRHSGILLEEEVKIIGED